MAQYVKQGNIFGRLGTGIGKGLAEQVPKEIERNRLSSGLKAFEQDHQDLNPMQQLARLSAIPGITPQMVQSFSELAKIQNQKNAYGNRGGGQGQQGGRFQQGPDMRSSPDLTQVKQANLLDQAANAGMPMQQEFNPQANPIPQGGIEAAAAGMTRNAPVEQDQSLANANPSKQGQPQIANVNAGDQRSLPRTRWTPEQRDQRITEYMNQGFLVDKAEQLAADDEARDLGEAEDLERRQEKQVDRGKKAEARLTEFLEERLQKSGEGLYQDVTGDMLRDVKRAMSKALIENPNASTDDIADDFSKRVLRMAKTKKEVEGLGATTGWESIFTGDKVLNKLRSHQKSFEAAGNQEEYFNILRNQFGLSPQGAASIAYPAKPATKKYIESYKPNNVTWGKYGPLPSMEKIDANSRKAALDISKVMDDDDSVLAIARMLSERDPNFDQRAFFEELSENPSIRLNPRQRTESGIGERDVLPTWGDIKIFPALKRSTK